MEPLALFKVLTQGRKYQPSVSVGEFVTMEAGNPLLYNNKDFSGRTKICQQCSQTQTALNSTNPRRTISLY